MKRLETLKLKIGFDNCIGMLKSDSCRGVALLWMNDVPVRVRPYSARHMDVIIGTSGAPDEWRFTGIYGYAGTSDRASTWALMRHLASEVRLPWLVAGFFNEVLDNSEKSGGGVRRFSQMQAF